MSKLILSANFIPIIGEGNARWNNVHVADLSDLYVLLCEAAVAQHLDPDIWGPRGYYLAENGEHLWSDIAKRIGQQAEQMGFIKSPETKTLSRDAALQQAGFEAESWGESVHRYYDKILSIDND